ncbi:MAG: hypothetical protein IPK82_28320 [Polyangiaceae bacterium]|nr:hypothetical protein [Polyangiaceae bacterium]
MTAQVACNEIFGIVSGEPSTGGGGTGAASTQTSSVVGGTGGTGGTGGSTTASTSSAGGTGGMTTSSSTGGNPCEGQNPPAPVGTPSTLRVPQSVGSDDGRGLAVDKDQNVIVVGSFTEGLNFGGGDLPYVGPPGYPDGNLFVAKYDSTGKHLYSRAFGGDEASLAEAVATDSLGNVYVVGMFSGQIDFDGNILAAPNDPGEHRYDAFVLKLTPSLDVEWVKGYGQNPWQQFALDVEVDSQDNVIVAGALFDKADLGKGMIGQDQIWSSYLLKLNSTSGDTVWSQAFGYWSAATPNYFDYPSLGVAIAPDDDIVLGGTLNGMSYFLEVPINTFGEEDAYVARISPDGTSLRWLQTFHGDPGAGASEGGQWIGPVAVDACGDVLVAGAYTHSLSIGGVTQVVDIGDPKIPDGFVAKLAGDTGSVIWHNVFKDDGRQEPHALATDAWGNVFVTGTLSDGDAYLGVDFGGAVGVLSPIVTPATPYRDDAFIVKYDRDGHALWGKRIGDDQLQAGYDLKVAPDGHVVWAGVFSGTIALGGGLPIAQTNNYDTFTVWLNP